jgi:predicted RNA binding protein YcfA (HicA-like mRNA interferase family)
MSKTEKLLDKARCHPAGLSFDEFKTLMVRSGWVLDHQTGSHAIWYSPGRCRLPIQPAGHGKAKAYQVKQFLKILEEEENDGRQV